MLAWGGDDKMDESAQKKSIEDFGKGGGIFFDIFTHQLKRLGPQEPGLSRGLIIAQAINCGIIFSDDKEKNKLKIKIKQLEDEIIRPALNNVSVFIPKKKDIVVQPSTTLPNNSQKTQPVVDGDELGAKVGVAGDWRVGDELGAKVGLDVGAAVTPSLSVGDPAEIGRAHV